MSFLEQQERRAKRVHKLYGILPTIGCEIEVKWSSLFPEVANEYFGPYDELGRPTLRYDDLSAERQTEIDDLSLVLDATLKPKYEEVAAHGIPAGADAYWEFANRPTYHCDTLATEVRLLYAAGLIPDGNEHSLHITVGGVMSDGGGPALVLSALELMHVSPARIIAATLPNKYGTSTSWARRGNDGIRSRGRGFMQLGLQSGTELRSLTSSNPIGTQTVLEDAQLLSAVLLAYRHRYEEALPDDVTALGRLWPGFRQELTGLWKERNLKVESWGPPHKNPTAWLGWAACLEARANPDSQESTVIYATRSVVDKARYIVDSL
jgi:hypothetical protein